MNYLFLIPVAFVAFALFLLVQSFIKMFKRPLTGAQDTHFINDDLDNTKLYKMFKPSKY